jgi:uncharacterized protein YigE (DUF2233 family)
MRWSKHIFVILLVLYIFTYLGCYYPTYWQTLAPGLEYILIIPHPGFPAGKLHAFRMDLQYYQLELAFTQNAKLPSTSVQELTLSRNATIGVNGGFFSPMLKPLGLRMNNGIVLNPLKNIGWWGIFLIKNSQAKIVTPKKFLPSKETRFAIQSGPRLIINGEIPSLKPGAAERSALGITKAGKVILLVTENLPLSTNQLAEIMRKPLERGGLDCVDALNLDGGHSSQLYAKIHNFLLNVPGISQVTDAILVVPREQDR